MPKSDLTLALGDYATVAERIALFYQRYPTGRILTDLVSDEGGKVVMKAAVYRTTSETGPAATGWAAEREDDGEINAVACIENTETSAVGRALANLGFAASSRRPSLEEMLAATRRHARQELTRSAPEAASPSRDDDAPPQRPRAPHFAPASPSNSQALHRQADDVMDLLDLIRTAERLGFPSRRAEVLRVRALAGDIERKRLARLAHRVRAWSRRASIRSLIDGTLPPPAG